MKKRKKQKFPVLLLLAGGFLLIFAAALFILQSGASQTTPPSAAASNGHDEETYPEIPRVSLDDAKAAFEAGTAVFVDVRGADVFAMSHIPGSLSIPLADLETRLAELDLNQWIITYCT